MIPQIAGPTLPKILVADDNPDELRIYSGLLYYNGFDVLQAASGEEAIRVARANLPDLVLVDYEMPMMSGLLVAEALSRIPETKNIPVVCMTAYDRTTERAQSSGCRELWHKPIAPGTLIIGIERLLKPAGPPLDAPAG